MNIHNLQLSIAAVVAAVVNAGIDGKEVSTTRKSAIETVRTLAVETADDAELAKAAIGELAVAFAAAKVKKGTSDPYLSAFKGYVTAISEGVPVDTGHGEDGDKPMTAPQAREFNVPKETREARRLAMDAVEAVAGMLAPLRKMAKDAENSAKVIELAKLAKEAIEGIIPQEADKAGPVVVTLSPLAAYAAKLEQQETEHAEPARNVA